MQTSHQPARQSLARVSIRHILCPVDLSETSERALVHARALAAWYAADITVLEAIWAALPPIALPAALSSGSETPLLAPAVRQDFERELELFCKDGGKEPPRQARVIEGPIVPTILEAASALPADLIVMGTHGRSGFDRLLLGSVTDKILRKATCPVLTIPPTASVVSKNGRYKTILCAVDFSPSSFRGLDYALSLAQETEAAITLAHVIEWPWTTGRPLTATEDGYRQAARDKALLDLREAVPPDVYDWCRPDVVLGEGRAHEEIVRMARDRQADLIVVGVHGRSALGMAVFGSTANQIIRHAECPVLTVRS